MLKAVFLLLAVFAALHLTLFGTLCTARPTSPRRSDGRQPPSFVKASSVGQKAIPRAGLSLTAHKDQDRALVAATGAGMNALERFFALQQGDDQASGEHKYDASKLLTVAGYHNLGKHPVEPLQRSVGCLTAEPCHGQQRRTNRDRERLCHRFSCKSLTCAPSSFVDESCCPTSA